MRHNLRDLSGSYENATLAEAIHFELVRAAAAIQPQGVSHRAPPFQVGVSGLGRRFSFSKLRWDYKIFSAANYKPRKENGPRICGEEFILEKAQEEGYQIVQMAIFAPPQKDDYLPHNVFANDDHPYHQTLKSCGYCRTNYTDILLQRTWKWWRKTITPKTRITSVNCLTGQDHTYTVSWLLHHYGDPQARWIHE